MADSSVNIPGVSPGARMIAGVGTSSRDRAGGRSRDLERVGNDGRYELATVVDRVRLKDREHGM